MHTMLTFTQPTELLDLRIKQQSMSRSIGVFIVVFKMFLQLKHTVHGVPITATIPHQLVTLPRQNIKKCPRIFAMW